MTYINRQKFLAELGKLLTFMFEKDRLAALALYNKLFDEAESEQALIALLVSPTRQAVCIARAYSSKNDDPEDPSYVRVLSGLRQDAISQGIIHPFGVVPAEQLSIFDNPPAAEAPDAPAPAAEAAKEAEPAPATAEEAPSAENTEANEPSGSGEDKPSEETEPKPEEAPVSVLGETVALDEASFVPIPKRSRPSPDAADIPEFILDDEEPEEAEPERKPRWFLLIVYILFAIPITVAGLTVLLVPTFVSMAVAGVLGAAAVTVFLAAIGSGFAVIADILVMIGIALILLAIALLFLWLFIWFIGGAMVGLVNGVISLGRRWCYKEVEAV